MHKASESPVTNCRINQSAEREYKQCVPSLLATVCSTVLTLSYNGYSILRTVCTQLRRHQRPRRLRTAVTLARDEVQALSNAVLRA